LVAKKIAEDNPAVIIPDHLQVTNTECVSLSFGSFGSGAFSGLLPQKTTDSNVELPVREESAPVDQLDARYAFLLFSLFCGSGILREGKVEILESPFSGIKITMKVVW